MTKPKKPVKKKVRLSRDAARATEYLQEIRDMAMLLRKGPHSARMLADALLCSRQTAYNRMKVLKDAGFKVDTRVGLYNNHLTTFFSTKTGVDVLADLEAKVLGAQP